MRFSKFNSITETQKENLSTLARELFGSEDFSHFEFLGTRLNFENCNLIAGFEIHSKNGSFLLQIKCNDKNKGLKRGFELGEFKL
tara:strand:- start:10 stop:264 length:255 start_codon:yes stop_codon:yes gene_type:complete